MQNKSQFQLEEILQKAWKDKDIFSHVFDLQGQIFRSQKNRKTLRFEIEGQGFFAKLHQGIGWREIVKNWLCARAPVWGALQEMRAIKKLQQLDVPTTPLIGFGQRGFYPARLRSFLITREITDVISLEDFCGNWLRQPPVFSLKRALIAEVARIARILHNNGVNHRDFYICHFLLETSVGLANISDETIKLYLIDLHRAQLRKSTPLRWRIKDIAGLYFSAMDLGLSRHDLLYFLKIYFDKSLREIFILEQKFLRRVSARALQLYGKEKKQQFTQPVDVQKNFQPSLVFSQFDSALVFEQPIQRTGKASVVRARWGNHRVTAKFYVNYHAAVQEMEGYRLLKSINMVTPELLFSGWAQGQTVFVLLFEVIDSAHDTRALWLQLDNVRREQLLRNLIAVLAKLHAKGLKQKHVTLDDFLLSDDKIYLLNTGRISKDSYPVELAPQISLKNLSLLFADLPAFFREKYADFYRYYCQCRNMIYNLGHLQKFKNALNQAYRNTIYVSGRRLFNANDKLIRRKTWRTFWVCDRAYESDAMRIFLDKPEAVLEGPTAKVLKSCATTSVILININDRLLVVKRYNIKSFLHALKRAFRSTRAAICWRSAHLFSAADIQTPKPVAMLEKRFGPLRSTSYFISEYVKGSCLQTFFAESNSPEEKMFIGDKLFDLFKKLNDVKVSHGDFKATNILLSGVQPVLLDLDAVCFHRCTWRWNKANRRDRQRFMKNWANNSEVREMFKALVD